MSDDGERWAPPTPEPQGGQPNPPGRRGLFAGGAILVAVAVAVVVLMVTGDDGGGSDVEGDLAAWISVQTGVGDDAAACVADLMVDEVGADAFSNADFDSGAPPPELIGAAVQVGFDRLLDECGVEDLLGGSGGIVDGTGDTIDDGAVPTFDGATDLGQLASDCQGGDFVACDELYNQSPFGSDLEDLGSTCGGIAAPQFGFCDATDGGQGDADDSGTGSDADSG